MRLLLAGQRRKLLLLSDWADYWSHPRVCSMSSLLYMCYRFQPFVPIKTENSVSTTENLTPTYTTNWFNRYRVYYSISSTTISSQTVALDIVFIIIIIIITIIIWFFFPYFWILLFFLVLCCCVFFLSSPFLLPLQYKS